MRDQEEVAMPHQSAQTGWCWSSVVFFQRGANRIENKFQILYHLTILKPYDAHSQIFEEYRSQSIAFRGKHVIVSRTVKFNNDATFWTIKVGNVRPNCVLSPEFLAFQI